jgi:hypothetical protein
MRYYTENDVEITHKIKTGETKLVKTVFEALKVARDSNSYHYDVYSQEEGQRKQHAGFGIPK